MFGRKKEEVKVIGSKTLVCSVYDSVAVEFGPLFQVKTYGVAERYFRDLLHDVAEVDKDSYSIRIVAVFDKETGKLVSWSDLPENEREVFMVEES